MFQFIPFPISFTKMNIFKKPITAVTTGLTAITSNESRKENSDSSSSSSKKSTPAVLTISSHKQREDFNELNEIESQRIVEGLNNAATSIWSISAGISRVNRKRNRYTNVTPWDRTRVKLPVVDGSFSDYINASHIHLKTTASKMSNRYIACQGPLEHTTHHFWAMCFNELEKQKNDVIVVVMVTPLVENGMVKCDRYWPELHETWDFTSKNAEDGIKYEKLTLTNIGENHKELEDYLITELELKSPTKSKKVYHYYYYKWADAKVPPSIEPLIALSRSVYKINQPLIESGKPLVPIVHCSAGVGRSGTFMAFDHLFRDADKFRNLVHEDRIASKDLVYQSVCQLRNQRMMTVQTVYQYCFLYEAARTIYKR